MSDAVGGHRHEQLVTQGLRVHYAAVKAVDGVDLTLQRGQIMGLIGPNGAGKTTFMNAVSGFVPLTAGTVYLDSLDVSSWPPHKLVNEGVVRTFQDIATFPELSVFENIELGALGAGLNRAKARQRAEDLLERLELTHLTDLAASALPHGDERRVGIARAAALSPTFLLLDEPAAGLDDEESAALARSIAELRDELGCGVLLVEHDMHVIFGVCERIQVLDYGKTIAVGSPAEIQANPEVIAAYLGAEEAGLAEAH